MPFYFSTGIGPFRYGKRIGGGRRPQRDVQRTHRGIASDVERAVELHRERRRILATWPRWLRVTWRVVAWAWVVFLVVLAACVAADFLS